MTSKITHTTKEIVIPYDISANMCNIRIYVDDEGALCMGVHNPQYKYWINTAHVFGQMTDEELDAYNLYYEMRSRKTTKRLDSGRLFKYWLLRIKRRLTKKEEANAK